MARIRSIHPGLFTDEAWVSCSPLARVLVIGLWTDADDQGVFEWKPLQIKMRLLPGDAANVVELLAEIQTAGMIMSFEVDGKTYGAIRNFRKFQRPQKPNALHPLPDYAANYVGLSATSTVPVPDQSPTPTVEAQQMEDVEEEEGDKVSEANASSPAPPSAQQAREWSKDTHFTKAWDACTPQMRKRSKSREHTWAAWCVAAKAAGGGAKLFGALKAYLRDDPDVKRTGGPGFHVWLDDGKWDAAMPSAPERPVNVWRGPPEIRARVVMEQGEHFAVSYLDQCEWVDGSIRARTRYAHDRLTTLRVLKSVPFLEPVGAAA